MTDFMAFKKTTTVRLEWNNKVSLITPVKRFIGWVLLFVFDTLSVKSWVFQTFPRNWFREREARYQVDYFGAKAINQKAYFEKHVYIWLNLLFLLTDSCNRQLLGCEVGFYHGREIVFWAKRQSTISSIFKSFWFWKFCSLKNKFSKCPTQNSKFQGPVL